MHYNNMFEAKRYYNLLLGEYFESENPPNILLGAAHATPPHRSGTMGQARPTARSSVALKAAPFASGSLWRPQSGNVPVSSRPAPPSRPLVLAPEKAILQRAGSWEVRVGASGRSSPFQTQSPHVRPSSPPPRASSGRSNVLAPLPVDVSHSVGRSPKMTRSVYDLRDSSPAALNSLADGLNVLHLVGVPRQVSK
jgi:hypothetical protein